MDLEKIRFYRKLLNMQKCFCCALALTSLLSLPSACKKNNSKNLDILPTSLAMEIPSDEVLNGLSIEEKANLITLQKYTRNTIKYVRDNVIPNVKDNIATVNNYLESMFELSYPEKMEVIMERDHISYDDLDESIAGMIAESCEDGNNYDECYRTMSTLHNRTQSISMINYVNSLGKDGTSLVGQFEAKSQFAVYAHKSYVKYLGRIDLKGYQAAIDMLYSGIPCHNYLQFNNEPPKDGIPYDEFIADPSKKGTPYEHFYNNGNYYYTELEENDRIQKSDVENNILMNEDMRRVLERD